MGTGTEMALPSSRLWFRRTGFRRLGSGPMGFRRMARRCPSVPVSARGLVSAHAETQSRSKISPQRGIADHLVVFPIQQVLDVQVGRDPRMYRVPASGVD